MKTPWHKVMYRRKFFLLIENRTRLVQFFA